VPPLLLPVCAVVLSGPCQGTPSVAPQVLTGWGRCPQALDPGCLTPASACRTMQKTAHNGSTQIISNEFSTIGYANLSAILRCPQAPAPGCLTPAASHNGSTRSFVLFMCADPSAKVRCPQALDPGCLTPASACRCLQQQHTECFKRVCLHLRMQTSVL
jgi:hypothetical protein